MEKTRGEEMSRILNEYARASLGVIIPEKIIKESLMKIGVNPDEIMVVKSVKYLDRNGRPMKYNQLFNLEPFDVTKKSGEGRECPKSRSIYGECGPMWRRLKEDEEYREEYEEFIRKCDEHINDELSMIYEKNLKELNEYMESNGMKMEMELPSREGRCKRLMDMKAINYLVEVNGINMEGMMRNKFDILISKYPNRVNVGTWCEESRVPSTPRTPSVQAVTNVEVEEVKEEIKVKAPIVLKGFRKLGMKKREVIIDDVI